MKQLVLLLALIGIMTNSYSQSTLLWSRDFTTGLNDNYSKYPIIQVVADTIQIIGVNNTTNGQRLLVVKYDLFGDTISTKIYGKDSVFNNTVVDYKFDTLNHVYILSKEKLDFYKSKIVLQKYSLDGNLIWVEQIQNPADTSFTPHSLGLANDTCIFISAYKEYDLPAPGDDVISTTTISQLYAFNSNGTQLWKREFDPISEIGLFIYNIFVNDNKAFLLNHSGILVQIDVNNTMTINTNSGIQNGVGQIQLTQDDQLLITAGFGRYRISKADLDGTVLWTYYHGTNLPPNVSADQINCTLQDPDGNILITGRHSGENYGTPDFTGNDIVTIKFDSNGNLIWQNRYAYLGHNSDIGMAIALKNGQVYVGGSSQRSGQGSDNDYVVLKIDAETGELTGVYRYNGLASGHDIVSSLFVLDNGNVVLTGLSYMDSQYSWTTQLLSDITLSVQDIDLGNDLAVYPNPTASGGILTVDGNGIKSYSMVSAIGQLIQQGNFGSNGLHLIHMDNVPSGIYLLRLMTDKGIVAKKLIIE